MKKTAWITNRKPAGWMLLAFAIGMMGLGTLGIVSATAISDHNVENHETGFGFAAIASEAAD